MRNSSRAIIIENGKLLTMFRRKIKDGKLQEYYAIPGGGQEPDETREENVKRELMEEMSIEIEILGLVGVEHSEEGDANYFHCKILKGTPVLGGEELLRMTDANYYEPRFVEVDDLDKINIFGMDFIQKAINRQYEE